MKGILLIGAGLMWSCLTFSQKTVKTSTVEMVRQESWMSQEQAQEQACELAKKKAIEEVFGEVFIQGNATYIINRQTGDKVESDITFNQIANSYVRGKWVKTENGYPKTELVFRDQEIWAKCEIKGYARELSAPPFEIKAGTYSCPEEHCRQKYFKDGEQLYLKYQAPNDGYITIYLDDGEHAFQMYPYKGMSVTEYKKHLFKAQVEYLLFSTDEKYDFTKRPHEVTELILTTGRSYETNRIFVLYSEKPFVPPLMENNLGVEIDGYELPNHLPSETFQRWMQDHGFHDETMVKKIIDVEISKR